MKTEYQIIGLDGIATLHKIEWPWAPGFAIIRDIV